MHTLSRPASTAVLVLLALGVSGRADQETKPAGAVPTGSARLEWDVGDTSLVVFTYKPKDYKDGPLILVFHGVGRNAESYRDSAKDLADRHGALIVAPLFDEKRFPTRLYQRGGLLTREGKATPKEQWTWQLVPKLADRARRLEGRPDMPYYLLGHSGGGQFLVRLAGFVPTEAKRIVAANPGTHLFPNHDLPFPYGFGQLPAELSNDDVLRRYLGQPLTIYLGTADTQSDDLDDSENANKQGATRYQRGLNAFRAAEHLAKLKSWEVNWRLVEAKDVGHSARAMFADPMVDRALFGEKGAPPKP
jgi:pimeloyl-ACP methyl ester carboxylesterase